MKSFFWIFGLSFVIACSTDRNRKDVELSKSASKPLPLDYDYADKGPNVWGRLNPKYKLCADGRLQSPIDLKWSKPQGKRDLSFFYIPGVYQIEKNLPKFQVVFSKGNYAVIDGKKWSLIAMQAHMPSEHSFSGKRHIGELQFVHYDNKTSKLGIVSVFLKPGRSNAALAKLLKYSPKSKSEKVLIDRDPLNPASFLPLASTHYYYKGSITHPPCTEGVDWTVLNTPIEASRAQLQALSKIIGRNARPIQRTNGRKVINVNKY